MPVELDALRAVNERLRPLRRFMDDLQLAAEMLGEVEGQISDRKTELEHLEVRVKDEVDTISELELLATESREALEREKERLTAASHLAQAEHVVFLEGLERERQALQVEMDRKRSATEQEFDEYLRALQVKQSKADAEYERLVNAVEALKGQLKGLLN